MPKKISPSLLYVFLTAIAIVVLPLSARSLTYDEIKRAQTGKILGESTYSPTTLVKNRSLEVYITPTSFEQEMWQYKIEWNRTLPKNLSIYLNNQPLVEDGQSYGSALTGFILSASSRNKLEIYSLPFRQGVLLSRKYFTALTQPETVVACTQDAKLCDDGKTYVSRQGPSCEFAACPTTNTVPIIEEKASTETNRQEPFIWMDGVDTNKEQSGNVAIVGWAVDGKDGWESQLGKLEILIDNQVVASWKKGDPLWENGNGQWYGVYRPDVCTYLKLVPNCQPDAANLYNRTGFHYGWDSTKVSDGTHEIVIRATDSGTPAKVKEMRWMGKVKNAKEIITDTATNNKVEFGSSPLSEALTAKRPSGGIQTTSYLIYREYGTNGNINYLAKQYDYLWFDQSSLAKLASDNTYDFSEFTAALKRLKALNPNIKIGVHAGSAAAMAPYHLPFKYLSDEDFLHSPDGRTLKSSADSQITYINIGSALTRQKLAAAWKDIKAQNPALTGINIDGYSSFHTDPVMRTGCKEGACQSKEYWKNNLIALSQTIKTVVPDLEVTYNGLFNVTDNPYTQYFGEMNTDLIDYNDGILAEWPHEIYRNPQVFSAYLEKIKQITAKNKKVIFWVQPDIFKATGSQVAYTKNLDLERFYLAAYLLIEKNPLTYFGYHPGLIYNGTEGLYFYKDWNADFGNPLGDFVSTSDGLYTRTFGNGLAVVNPTTQALNYTLPVGWSGKEWDPANGNAVSGTVTIPALTGKFYFNQTSSIAPVLENKQEPFIWMDGVDTNKEQSGNVAIVGWAVDGKDGWESQLGKLEILIDNQVVASWKKGDPLWENGNGQWYGVYRPDVCTYLKLVPNCQPDAANLYNRTGFHYGWDSTKVSDGTHNIIVRATDAGSPPKVKETKWSYRVKNKIVTQTGNTVYAANYFIHSSGGGKVEGPPVEFYPNSPGMYHQVGEWNNASQKDYWKSKRGTTGFLSYGPYIREQDLEAAFVQKNPNLSQRGNDWYIYRVGWELKVENNAFSNKPVGSVDILASTENNEFYLVRSIDIYPQDFKQNDTFQEITMLLADFHAAFKPNPRLEFRVRATGTGGLALRAVKVYPLAFLPFWSSWSGMSWSREKGFVSSDRQDNRMCDPERILTSRFEGGQMYPLNSIDWWRRDVCFTSGSYPYIGPYNQFGSEETMRYQIRLAKAAGIDAFRLYYYPPDTYSQGKCKTDSPIDQGLFMLFNAAEKENFKIFLDDSMLSELVSENTIPEYRGYSYEDAACNIEILGNAGLFTREGYLKIDSRPVFAVPAIFETDPKKLEGLMQKLNTAYQKTTGQTNQLYTLVTAMTTYAAHGDDSNIFGPYNGQMNRLWFSGRTEMKSLAQDKRYSAKKFDNQIRNWQRYAVCSKTPATFDDVVNPNKCQCKFDKSRGVDAVCFFKATILEREEMAPFRNLSGVTSLYDWTNTMSFHGASYEYLEDGGTVTRGAVDVDEIGRVFEEYVNDAHKYGYKATITLSPNQHNLTRVIDFKGQKVVRFREVANRAAAAKPDIIMLEAFNNWGEGVQLEPAVDYTNEYGQNDPYLFLRILAQSRGQTFVPPCIPASIVDPLRLPYLPAGELCDH